MGRPLMGAMNALSLYCCCIGRSLCRRLPSFIRKCVGETCHSDNIDEWHVAPRYSSRAEVYKNGTRQERLKG